MTRLYPRLFLHKSFYIWAGDFTIKLKYFYFNKFTRLDLTNIPKYPEDRIDSLHLTWDAFIKHYLLVLKQVKSSSHRKTFCFIKMLGNTYGTAISM